MIDDNILDNFKRFYKNLHPLVFHRSLEKSKNSMELFEILQTIPKCPFSWDDANKSWKKNQDLLIYEKVKKILD